MTQLQFDLDEIPFSTRGSWLSVSRVVGLHMYADLVHLVSHTTGMHPIFAFEPRAGGAVVEAELCATPSTLEWRAQAGTVTAVFEAPGAIRVRGTGLGMCLTDPASELTSFTGNFLFVSPFDGSAVMTSYETGRRYRVSRIDGAFDVAGAEMLGLGDRSIHVGADGRPWEIAIEEVESELGCGPSDQTFDQVVATRSAEFEDYARAIVPSDTATARLAAYVLWSATVEPSGFIGREAVLMSKHWMDKVWSWDHCFNALALAEGSFEAAMDQFLLPFDHQSADGALPDSITHSEVLYNFVKPPIHGWAFSRLRERAPEPLGEDRLREVYDRLAAWSRFWLERRAPGSALPYYEHGNDSGWDNSTVFDAHRLIESPDLAAFLLVQLHVVGELASELGEDPTPWLAQAQALQDALVTELRDGDRLFARSVVGHEEASSTSLLTALPILAARHLPQSVVEDLARQIESHLTEWGPATELVDSPLYESDGYWRGPIWAPSTYLIVSGLRSAGMDELADEIGRRFCRLCESSGFAENFDAVTSRGLRDRAYTWTAAVYLLLLGEQSGDR